MRTERGILGILNRLVAAGVVATGLGYIGNNTTIENYNNRDGSPAISNFNLQVVDSGNCQISVGGGVIYRDGVPIGITNFGKSESCPRD